MNFFSFQAEDGIRYSSVTGVQTCAFFIQAEDGIRDSSVTGVQTCALPISSDGETGYAAAVSNRPDLIITDVNMPKIDGIEFVKRVRIDRVLGGVQIGRASCRERV